LQIYLLTAVFISSVCGLVYELLAGTLSSYLVGDSVLQFSLVIGIFMTSMGLGSFLSRYINEKLHDWFVFVEVLTGVVGGTSSIVLFFAFSHIENYTPFLFIISIVVGTLIGLEIPIILRILKEQTTLKILFSNVLTADYIGAFFASLLFPLVLVPQLGLVRASLVMGLMNVVVGTGAIFVFKDKLADKKGLTLLCASSILLLSGGLVYAENLTSLAEDRLYRDEIIYTAQTPYQRVVVTKTRADFRMFINGAIQFSSQDEYRYHEALVLPAMSLAHNRENILIIGGGDGLAAREVLKFKDIKSITLVDIDPAITDFARTNPMMRKLNLNSMNNEKVKIVNADAWKFLETVQGFYDVIIIDLPDPYDLNLSRLYSRTFYRLLSHKLSRGGIIVTQSTSPMYAHKAYWCIYNTFAAVENPLYANETASATKFLEPRAYHAYVPSFGVWGFVMASNTDIKLESTEIEIPSRFVTTEFFKTMCIFPEDMDYIKTEVNTIDSHAIKAYYEQGWELWTL
jgi:spermidine synthase